MSPAAEHPIPPRPTMVGRVAVALILVLAAGALASSLPLGWGAADAPDGTRFKVSPLGISHVLALHQTVSPTEDCRWADAAAADLCAIRPGAAFAAGVLRLVPVLVLLAAMTALFGALGWLAPDRQLLAPLRRAAVIGPPAIAGLALLLFSWAVPRASAALAGLSFGVGGTKATMQLSLMVALLLGFAAMRLVPASGWRRTVGQTVWAGLGVAPFLLMFPPAGGLALAFGSLGTGAGVARLAGR